jgi:hypothetical protein
LFFIVVVSFGFFWCVRSFWGTGEVIRSRKSKKDGQYNSGQMKNNRKTNNGPQNTTEKD